MDSLRIYYELTKPGIVYGNTLNCAAGFMLAAAGHVRLRLFLATLAGTALVIGSACVFNNYLDRGIDSKMERTKLRGLASGIVPGWASMVYATLLAVAGFFLLAEYTNALTTWLGAFGLVSYVVFYGYAKRHSEHGTLVGTLPGAVPPVAGYCAVSGHFDSATAVLFIALVCWQMAHFFAIAIYRLKDYRAAGLPVLPAVKGIDAAKRQIMAYCAAFTISAAALFFLGYVGITYLVLVLCLGVYWLRRGLRGYTSGKAAWARRMFLASLIVIVGFDLLLMVGPLLP